MEYKDKKVMVVGMARSGIAAAKLLLAKGAEVLLYDQKTKEHFDVAALLLAGAQDCMGKEPMEVMKAADVLVLSPGVPTRLAFIKKAMAEKKPVISEIELGYQLAQAAFVCIGGTNGKTTTTALVGKIFKAAGKTTYVLGNIGVPISEYALETKPGDIIVAETAALQLETIDTFRPRAAALLNITEDHLDRFETMEYYTYAKMRMFENMQADDYAVFNADDLLSFEEMKKVKRAHLLTFSRKKEVQEGAFVREGEIIFRFRGKEEKVCAVDEIRIPGAHNLENALAAVGLSMSMGVKKEVVRETLRVFPGVEHRIEFVREVNGISFINDSKGTNPDATEKAILAMRQPTVLLLGGYDKESNFDALFAAFTENIVGAVLLGETKDKLVKAANAAEFTAYETADSFEEAVAKAYTKAQAYAKANVLLSPACASWDMFPNFEVRGCVFKEIVARIEG